ncbi:MAG: acyl carrier protein [Acidobacteriia bacterium]|nr:acyl carrier protein [Terriglobia bacterium]
MAEIRRVLSVELEIPVPAELHHELAKDLGVDSMGAIVLAVGLEDRFRVKLSDEDAGKIVTVTDLVNLVERRSREARTNHKPEPDQRQDPR